MRKTQNKEKSIFCPKNKADWRKWLEKNHKKKFIAMDSAC